MLVQQKQPLYFALFLAFVTIILSLFYRPLFPVDETRYISVAWEMWQGNNWLVPMKNGEIYTHKPPALFWLINIAWAVFGVSEFSARIIVPLIACFNYLLVIKLAALIYPNSSQATNYSPIILVSFFAWFVYVPSSMFDLLITLFVLITYIKLYQFALTGKYKYVLLAGVGFGLALLVKGPVALVYVIAMMLTYTYWRQDQMLPKRKWYIGSLISLGTGTLIVLSWAIPAVFSGGEAYANAIFWEQSAGRINNSFAHARPFYWYLLMLPIALSPWLIMKQFWFSDFKQQAKEARLGNKLCLSIVATVLLIFSCISGKQIHYLFPIFPILAIFIAHNLPSKMVNGEPFLALTMGIVSLTILSSRYWLHTVFDNADLSNLNYFWALIPAIAALILVNLNLINEKIKVDSLVAALVSFNLGVFTLIPFLSPILFQLYDLTPAAKYIHNLQQSNRQVAYKGDYHNQFQFLGRLTEPLQVIENEEDVKKNTVIVMTQHNLSLQDKVNSLFYTSYRGKYLVVKEAIDVHESSKK